MVCRCLVTAAMSPCSTRGARERQPISSFCVSVEPWPIPLCTLAPMVLGASTRAGFRVAAMLLRLFQRQACVYGAVGHIGVLVHSYYFIHGVGSSVVSRLQPPREKWLRSGLVVAVLGAGLSISCFLICITYNLSHNSARSGDSPSSGIMEIVRNITLLM